ncbi:MAG: hypothetical protein H7249_02150 [Chitinophagaceae bacterium]|nr:hypothetical protein [Oligoflexus sp.]
MAMEVKFPEKDLGVIIGKIKDALGGRELGKMVSFDQAGNEMIVTISKFGTSTLTFSTKQTATGSELTLDKEKIALAHRALKGEVTDKIVKVIQQAGGTVTA